MDTFNSSANYIFCNMDTTEWTLESPPYTEALMDAPPPSAPRSLSYRRPLREALCRRQQHPLLLADVVLPGEGALAHVAPRRLQDLKIKRKKENLNYGVRVPLWANELSRNIIYLYRN